MKSELVNVPGKGICILISDIDVNEFIRKTPRGNGVFSDVSKITYEILMGRKISAIKEIRAQTGWGLKESKDYLDKYMPSGIHGDYDRISDNFQRNHTIQDFILSEEMMV